MDESRGPRRSVLLSFRFLTVSIVGSVAMAVVSVLAALPAQIAFLGALLSVLAGLVLEAIHQSDSQESRRLRLLERLNVPVRLATDPELFARYSDLCEALVRLADRDDEVLREAALLRLTSLVDELRDASTGTLVFTNTETWRTVYERLLRADDVREYLSVAWVRTDDYWQDGPGRQSTRLNVDRAMEGLLIDRLVVIADDLWPRDAILPRGRVRAWLNEQHNHGIRLSLVRESEVRDERDLLVDVGIYGERAVGVQELDENCRTERFVLTFEESEVATARDRWKRLELYCSGYPKLLDRSGEHT